MLLLMPHCTIPNVHRYNWRIKPNTLTHTHSQIPEIKRHNSLVARCLAATRELSVSSQWALCEWHFKMGLEWMCWACYCRMCSWWHISGVVNWVVALSMYVHSTAEQSTALGTYRYFVHAGWCERSSSSTFYSLSPIRRQYTTRNNGR